ncbi:GNAT family N-acetyltransferase [Flavimarina sp. Hel_I_48]|uniref:GNAT family N-acetyltransferase n=1 Tax=Flavimarina sp. Hel_I_48 TaxID=1392488 RepID=UPI0004DFC906|nr:GNAT family N-acetyltransferase [Flavimarina sp. Hel_I_48]
MAITLKGKQLYLRALEPEDLEFIHQIENDEELWELSTTLTPYSRFIIKQYLKNVHRDIFEVKQLRLAICKIDTQEVLGMIDLYDYDPKHHRAGVGIIITSSAERGRGYGAEALQLITTYSFTHLDMHQLYANILDGNDRSIKLFEKMNFKSVGVLKDWKRIRGSYKNEHLYQLINTDVH